MKIEKLTENKIRVIVNPLDLNLKSVDIKSLSIALEKHTFFTEVLNKAKMDLGFDTEGYKLLIETFSLNDDFIIFTITKFTSQEKKKPFVKRKNINLKTKNAIYNFETFDDFCIFCSSLKNKTNLNYKAFCKDFSLYFYKNTYYLLIKNIIDIDNKFAVNKTFFSIISEFSNKLSYSNTFENKLIEYGKVIVKKNALEKGIKYLS